VDKNTEVPLPLSPSNKTFPCGEKTPKLLVQKNTSANSQNFAPLKDKVNI